MKKISATLVMAAVLNPLCCCWSLPDLSASVVEQSAAHACCPQQNEDPSQDAPSHDPANCEHEQVKNSTLPADGSIPVPMFSWVWLTHPAEEFESIFTKPHGNWMGNASPGPNVPRLDWVGIQTDCVRRL